MRIGASLALTFACLAALAACGSGDNVSSKSAAAILAASRTAARNATAVHAISQFFAAKRANNSKPRVIAKFDLELSESDGRANVAFLGSETKAVRIGQTLYVKGSPQFYRRLNERDDTHVPNGKWLKAPANNTELTSLAALTLPSGELTLLLRDPTLALTKGSLTTIDGHKAIELKTKGKLYSGAIYVAATGTPYPLQIVKHGRETSQTTFSNWNRSTHVAAPAAAVQLATAQKSEPKR